MRNKIDGSFIPVFPVFPKRTSRGGVGSPKAGATFRATTIRWHEPRMRSMPTRLADSASSTRMYRSLDASSLCPFSNGTPAVGSTTHSASAAATRRPTQCARQKHQAASEQSRSFVIIDQRAGRPALRIIALRAESWSDKSFESAACGTYVYTQWPWCVGSLSTALRSAAATPRRESDELETAKV